MAVAAPPAFPFVEVQIDTKGLQPVAQRAPGVIAVVGTAAGSAAANTPLEISTSDDAKGFFGATSTLRQSLELAMLQDPKPSKIYGVKVGSTTSSVDYAGGLSALEGVDDVTFVSLANEPAVASNVLLLNHVEAASKDGNRRIGVAMVDPALAKPATTSYVDKVKTDYASLKSTKSRMVLIAARGAKDSSGASADAATAAMAAMAGYEPHISVVLKPIAGMTISPEQRYGASEIKGLSTENVIPVIDPALIPGEGLYFGEGRLFTTDANLLYADIVRTLDKLEFDLKAGLVGVIGDARITKAGLMAIKLRTEGILGVAQRNEVIDGFKVQIGVLDAILVPEGSRTAADKNVISTARQTRSFEMVVEITYGPAVHYLVVKLKPVFA
jgi:hypothetical protein